jgi:hypothetical protein
VTAGGGAVTGGGDGRSAGAARQARYRERRRQMAMASAELAAQGREEARQAMLPLAPVGEMDETPGQALVLGGRPAGSVARSTAEMQRFILARYPSPLVGMAEVISRPVKDLAEELGCTPLEAMQLQARLMGDLAPYLHSKMPIAMQVDGAPIVPVVLQVSPEMAARMGAPTIEHDQPLSGDAAP